MEALSKIISIILIAVLIFLFPLQYLFGHQLLLMDDYVEDEAVCLVDDMRKNQYLDVKMYEDFLKKLNYTGGLYDIEIEHAVPKDSNKTASIKEIPGVLVASNNLTSIPNVRDRGIFSLATHIHTDSCYVGHNHTANGCVGALCDCGGTTVNFIKSATSYSKTMQWKCSKCGKILFQGVRTNNSSTSITDRISVFVPGSAGLQEVIYYNTDTSSGWAHHTGDVIAENIINAMYNEASATLTFEQLFSKYPQVYAKAGMSLSGFYYVGNRKTVLQQFYNQGSGSTTSSHSLLLYNLESYNTRISLSYVSYNNRDTVYTISVNTHDLKTYNYTCTYNAYGTYVSGLTWVSTLINKLISQRITVTYFWAPTYGYYTSYNPTYFTVQDVVTEFTPYITNISSLLGITWSPLPKNCGIAIEDTNPICNQVVTSITPTKPTQAVDIGGTIDSTVTATYLDGHTGTITCSNNFNSELAGPQNVTLTYSGRVGSAKTTGTRTCTVAVTVMKSNIPASLAVTPSSTTVYNGTEPTYTVKVTYTSGSTKILTGGYIKTGWSTSPGVKNVNFSYTENDKTVTVSVTVTVKPNVSSITVIPNQLFVERYKDPVFTVLANYEDGTTRSVLGYSISEFNNDIIGLQTITIEYTEGSVSKSITVTITVTPMKRLCPVCGNQYFMNEYDFDQGCPICKTNVSFIQVSPEYVTVNRNEPLSIVVTANYLDGHTETVTGWTSNFNASQAGYQMVTITYQDKYTYVGVTVLAVKICTICGTEYGLNPDGTDPGCPTCRENHVSINASPTNQTVNQGDDIELVVTGLYRDGHIGTILDWSSNYDKDKAGEQIVTVFHRNLTCNVNVMVVSKNVIQCPICSIYYNYWENPWGCPICADTLVSLEAVLRNGGTKVPYGRELDLRVILIYRDEHREMVFEGWTDTFDAFTLGIQSVTISYIDRLGNTVSCLLNIEVVDKLTKTVCENGHAYYPDDSLSGCPYCAALSGDIVGQYYECSYTEEILNKLYTDGIYNFNSGDYITIKVTMKTEGSVYSLGLFRKKDSMILVSSYGGEVD